jgi:toxin ParE1/3/4
MKVVWSPTAIDDLVHLRAYIAESNPGAAARVAERILEVIEHLVRFPGIGRPGRVANTREIVIADTPFLIVYTVKEATLRTVAVLHGARRWPSAQE